MAPHKIQVKLFAELNGTELSDFIPVFHRWIRENAVEGLLIDVANYEHVDEGPGMMLIGHDVDYSIDLTHGRVGLLFAGKRGWESDSLADRLAVSIRRALLAAYAVTQAEELDGKVTFNTAEMFIALPDRLAYTNSAETFARIEGEVAGVLADVFGDSAVSLSYIESDARRPLAMTATISDAPELAALAATYQPAAG